MYTKGKKTISHVTPQRPMTQEEQKQRIMQFLAQKRESFSISILCSLLQNNPGVKNEDVIIKAVDLADGLMEKLYPMPKEEKPKEETPAEKERERLKGNLKEEVCASDVCAYRGKNVCTIKRDEYCPVFKAKEDKE